MVSIICVEEKDAITNNQRGISFMHFFHNSFVDQASYGHRREQ